MQQRKQFIIFTDLDGTYDHDNYSFNYAVDILARLLLDNIPIILVSSKTQSEAISSSCASSRQCQRTEP